MARRNAPGASKLRFKAPGSAAQPGETSATTQLSGPALHAGQMPARLARWMFGGFVLGFIAGDLPNLALDLQVLAAMAFFVTALVLLYELWNLEQAANDPPARVQAPRRQVVSRKG